MTLVVGHGCIAGALSPIAPTGIIANGLMSHMGMSGFERQNYLYNLVANALAATAAYVAFGGLRLWRQIPQNELDCQETDRSNNGNDTQALDHSGSHRDFGDRGHWLAAPRRDGQHSPWRCCSR